MSRYTVVAALLAVVLLFSGCGGGSSAPVTAVQDPNSIPPPTPPPSGNPSVNDPAVVAVSAGQDVTGIDIAVALPADSPSPNAEMLGVTAVGTGGSASNVGDVIHRGATVKVLLFGPGLSGALRITISGPADIAVSNIAGITSVSGIPGVSFDAAVSSNAALGARTVRLRGPHDDISTFAGGLEVLP